MLLDNWTSLDVTLSETDSECVRCFDEESNCLYDHLDWDQSSSDLLPRRTHSTGAAGRRPRTSLLPRTLFSAELRSTLASLQCSTRAVYVSRLAVDDVTRLTTSAADLETELLRFIDRLQSTYTGSVQSSNQSIRDCPTIRATSRLIVKCIKNAGSHNNVRI